MKILKGLVGVTLIELMITALIIAITSIIITTVYSSYTRKERRSDVMNVMNSIVRVEEKYRNPNSKYNLLAEISNRKANFAKKYHLIAISNISAATYTVIAMATGDQINDATKGTSCALMQLKKSHNLVTKTPEACWSV